MAARSTDEHEDKWEQLRVRLAKVILAAVDSEATGSVQLTPFAPAYRAIIHEATEFEFDTAELEKWALATALYWRGRQA